MPRPQAGSKRVVLVAATVAVVVPGGIATAAELTGGNDTVSGTSAADVLRGLAGPG